MQYRPEIDGLRALAVVPVILFHAGFSIFSGGFIGVDVFFVISGYLITTILINDIAQGRFSLMDFYERRARRILPALFVMLAVSTAIAWVTLMPKDMLSFSKSLAAVSLFASNILFWKEAGYFDTAAEMKPLLHTWSLAVEEQFYIFFPPVLYALWRWGQKWMLGVLIAVFAVSLALAHWGAYNKPSSAFYLLPTRAWELLIGSFCALYLQRVDHAARSVAWHQIAAGAGFIGLIASMLLYDKTTPIPSLYTLAPVLSTALIILFATPHTWVNRLLSVKIFVGIGLISYSAYLWHQPLFAFARYRNLVPLPEATMLLLCAVTFGIAYLSWRYIEAPFRSKTRIKRGAIFNASAAGIAVCLAAGFIGFQTEGFKGGRLPAPVAAMAAYEHDDNPFRGTCFSGPKNYVQPQESCVLGAEDNVRGVLMGDSHSDALAYPLHLALETQNIGLKHMWYNGCPPMQGLHVLTHKNDYRCGEFNDAAFDLIYNDPSLEYVVLTGRLTIYLEGASYDNGEGGIEKNAYFPAGLIDRPAGPYPEEERRADVLRLYAKQVTDLLEAGKKVVLVYPVPEQGWNVPLFVAKTLFFSGDAIDLSVRHDSFEKRNAAVIANFDALPEHPNLFRVKPAEILCDTFIKDRCVGALNQKSFYYDDDHLSNYGASYITPEIARHIQPQPQPVTTARVSRERVAPFRAGEWIAPSDSREWIAPLSSREWVAIPPELLLEDRPEERRLVHNITVETGAGLFD